ncbi:hypothetical protein EJ02DRAFT_439683 [Clathrospora elynae]|uniref:F-box domain-containing protein n=1 Tax=Clathrospora elynae TaxID=706981 RepID=A0A6A5SBB6_9PLEO|nr:hypothetical protein EJ02DRAFT_439683 [Clathrospora elynae]
MMDNPVLISAFGSYSARSLNDLPEEILLHILSYVDLHRNVRIMGYIPDDPPPSPPDPYLIKDFTANCSSLRNLALTCKRFAPLAQENLLYAPVLEADFPSSASGFASSRIFGLILRFIAKPELKRHVRKLRICLPSSEPRLAQRDGSECSSQDPESGLSDDVLEEARQVIASLEIPQYWKEIWCARLETRFIRTSVALLSALLPQLGDLCISENKSFLDRNWMRRAPLSRHLLGLHHQEQIPSLPGLSLQLVEKIPVVQSLTYLKFESQVPLRLEGLDDFPNLHTLDMSLRIRGLPSNIIRRALETFLTPEIWPRFRNIHHLRLDFEVRTVGIWQITERTCMSSILQAFRNLQSLEYYAESSGGKNPYRSIRAFPHYQANIQNYPDMSSPLDLNVANETYWDRNIYDSRTEITDYQHLVDGLVHLRPQLESLHLPGGFWTLPGAVRKPLPRFDQFTRLTRMIVPQAAIISIKLDNMRFDAVSSGDFELSPSIALPPMLQQLKIFDADTRFLESIWLSEFFSEQRSYNRWQDLQCLEILLGPTYSDHDLEALLARRSDESFWKQVDEATFEVLVGRDAEGPEVCVDHKGFTRQSTSTSGDVAPVRRQSDDSG